MKRTITIIEKMNEAINNAKKEISFKQKADTQSNVHNVKLSIEIANMEKLFVDYKEDVNAKYSSFVKLLETELGLKKTQVNTYRKVGKFMSNPDNYKRFHEYSLTMIDKLMPLAKENSPLLEAISKDTTARELREMKQKMYGETPDQATKKKATKADIKKTLNQCLHSDDVQEIKAMIKNLLADL